MEVIAVIEGLAPVRARVDVASDGRGVRRIRFLVESDAALNIGDRVVVDFLDGEKTRARLVEVLRPPAEQEGQEAQPAAPPPPKARPIDAATAALIKRAASRMGAR